MDTRLGAVTVVALCIAVAGCSSSEGGASTSSSSVPSSSVTEATVAASSSTTTVAETTTTVAETTTTTTIPEATDEERAPMEAFIEAYASQDAVAIESVFAGDPEIEFTAEGTSGTMWTLDLMQMDAAFSSKVFDSWQLGRCTVTFDRVTCQVSIQDELGRLSGLENVEVALVYTAEDGQWSRVSWTAFAAWGDTIHIEMHTYGDWYEAANPDSAPIQGFHYRGWNVKDPTAGDRYMESLDDYLASGVGIVSSDFPDYPIPVLGGYTAVVTDDAPILEVEYANAELETIVAFYEEWTVSRDDWSLNEPNADIGVYGAFVKATNGDSISVLQESPDSSVFVLMAASGD